MTQIEKEEDLHEKIMDSIRNIDTSIELLDELIDRIQGQDSDVREDTKDTKSVSLIEVLNNGHQTITNKTKIINQKIKDLEKYLFITSAEEKSE